MLRSVNSMCPKTHQWSRWILSSYIISEKSILMLSFRLWVGFLCVFSFCQILQMQFCIRFTFLPFILHASPILYSSTCFDEERKSEVLLHTVTLSLLLCSLSYVQVRFSAFWPHVFEFLKQITFYTLKSRWNYISPVAILTFLDGGWDH